MVQGLFIPVDLDRPIEVRSFDSLEDYQTAVGGWIEAVDILPLESTLYVNDEGLLRGLPLNLRATFLYWYQLPRTRHEVLLVGDAVLVGLPDDDGETTDIPPLTMALLTEKNSYVVVSLYEGSPRWAPHPFAYDDYFEAVVWAIELSDPVLEVRAVRVLTAEQFEKLHRAGVDRENWGNWNFDEDE